MIKVLNVQLIFPTFYFDTESFDNPVTISGLKKKTFGILPSLYQEVHVPIQANEATVYDDYFNTIYPKTYKYVSVEEIDNTFLTARINGDLMEVQFELSPKYLKTERKVYSFMEVLGQVGGIIGILLPVGAILSSIFSSRIYIMTLLSLLFQVDQTQTSKVSPISGNIFKFVGNKIVVNRAVSQIDSNI